MDEEKLERDEMMKGMHPLMKAWYHAPDNSYISGKYGEFPAYHQELGDWKHIKFMQKLFLQICEKKESGESSIDNKAMEIDLLVKIEKGAVEVKTEHDVDDVEDRGRSMEPTGKRAKKSRWQQGEIVIPNIIGLAGNSNVSFSKEIANKTIELTNELLKIADRLPGLAIEAAYIEQDPDRSPSPPPTYDSHGKRTNTREIRMNEKLVSQRGDIIEELIKINPLYKPPTDYTRKKPFAKIFMPIKEFPTYNFIGLIIGPRGNTQRQLEADTGCKISIRGKGSVKDGSKGRSTDAVKDSESEDLHVFLQGEDQETVDKGSIIIEKMMKPLEDHENEHKLKQLRELAVINGTLRTDEYCTICGEKGHRLFECPHKSKTFQAAGVKCKICGDASHPTRDCPQKKKDSVDVAELDNDYNDFMAELNGDASGTRAPSSTSHTSSGDANSNNGHQHSVQPVQAKKQQKVIICSTVLTGAPLDHLKHVQLPPRPAAPTEMYAAAVPPPPPSQPPAQYKQPQNPPAYGGYGQQQQQQPGYGGYGGYGQQQQSAPQYGQPANAQYGGYGQQQRQPPQQQQQQNGQHSSAVRGRGISNKPAWMTQTGNDAVEETAPPQPPVQQEQEQEQIQAPQAAQVASSNPRGISNQPAWMTTNGSS